MGRRSRKRGATEPAPAGGRTPEHNGRANAPAPPRGRERAERPRAPWHPFPLVELCVLVGLVLLVWGLLRGGDDGRILLVCGTALASLGGLETALREHFSGHSSHSVLLAALPAVLAAGVLFFAQAPWIAIPLTTAAVFAVAFTAARRAFRRRS
jgi:hypothetical protein